MSYSIKKRHAQWRRRCKVYLNDWEAPLLETKPQPFQGFGSMWSSSYIIMTWWSCAHILSENLTLICGGTMLQYYCNCLQAMSKLCIHVHHPHALYWACPLAIQIFGGIQVWACSVASCFLLLLKCQDWRGQFSESMCACMILIIMIII